MATFETGGYPVPPPGYATYDPRMPAYDYRTPPPRTPPRGQTYNNYSPRHYTQTANDPPFRAHVRRATTLGADTYTHVYTSSTQYPPRYPPTYATTHEYMPRQPPPPPMHSYAKPHPTPSQPQNDYVSNSDFKRRAQFYRATADGDRGGRARKHATFDFPEIRQDSPWQSSGNGYDRYYEYHERYDDLPRYAPHEPRPPPYTCRQSYYYTEPRADHRNHDQMPIYTSAETPKPRKHSRRQSDYPSKPTMHTDSTPKPSHYDRTRTPKRPSTSTSTRKHREATAEDAIRASIPAGYSYKNWDPDEEPILLVGSVFDANSLGKWIYDWAVFYFGPATPMADVAGELWLLLIKLAQKIRRAEEAIPKITSRSAKILVNDFLESGERIWQRFNSLLKICEKHMYEAARKDSRDPQHVTMGKNSGCEFVSTTFGRDRELENTEKIMHYMRTWDMRFDANCEEILRNPSAAE